MIDSLRVRQMSAQIVDDRKQIVLWIDCHQKP